MPAAYVYTDSAGLVGNGRSGQPGTAAVNGAGGASNGTAIGAKPSMPLVFDRSGGNGGNGGAGGAGGGESATLMGAGSGGTGCAGSSAAIGPAILNYPVAVTPGQVLTITVGAGGSGGYAGGGGGAGTTGSYTTAPVAGTAGIAGTKGADGVVYIEWN